MEDQASPVFFSDWLKRRRKTLDMTQGELASRVGCSVGALRKIEAGDRRPSKQLAELLSKALEIPVEDQPIFIRVARGESNLNRLRQPSSMVAASVPDSWSLEKAQHGASPSAISNLREATMPAQRIPLQTTSLVGREAELNALERLFSETQCRLLTLTGIGGIGKTRLALEFAAHRLPLFPGGIFYISLGSINSPEEIIPAIASVLGLSFSGPTDPKEQLLNYISGQIKKDALFILDSLEHLLNQMGKRGDKFGLVELVSEMLARLPDVRILGTSRERLNLHGEWVYEIHGLSVPPSDFVGQMEQYDSVALFVKSAQRIKVDFEVLAEDQQPLIHICQMVEGVPLAIELAAAWVGMLSCQEIAREIQANMDFLTTSMRDIPERHRSIRATFDHSWKLLSEEERTVLCRLSVFQGGFDRYAANHVAGASLPLLASLNTKSIVWRTTSDRYNLHEVIRQYCTLHLEDHPLKFATQERHCHYYLELVSSNEKSLKSAAQQEAIRQLSDEIDNIRAAWAWAIQHEQYIHLAQAGRAFGWYFENSGLYHEGIEHFEPLVQKLITHGEDDRWHRLLGLTLTQQALLYFRKGEHDHARKLYEESIAILRPVGDQNLLADGLTFLGIILHLRGEYIQAKSALDEALYFARACNERWFEAYAIYNLGYIASLMGSYAEGYALMLTGLDIWRALGDPNYIALGLNFMVTTLNKLGRYEEAKACLWESMALCERTNNRWGMGTAYRFLGLVSLAEGHYAQAKDYLLKSLEIFSQYIVGWDVARSLSYLGYAALMSGDTSAARGIYLDALRSAIETKSIPIALDALSGLASLQAHAGKTEQALVLCYCVLSHDSSEQDTKSHIQHLCAELEMKLDSKQVAAVRSMAAKKSFESIVEETLEVAIPNRF